LFLVTRSLGCSYYISWLWGSWVTFFPLFLSDIASFFYNVDYFSGLYSVIGIYQIADLEYYIPSSVCNRVSLESRML
jgi:hypothetical protein